MNVLVIPSWYPPNGGMFFVHQTQWLMDEGIQAAVIVAEEKSLRKFSLKSLKRDTRVMCTEEYGIRTCRKIRFRIPGMHRLNARLWIKTASQLAEYYIHQNGKPDLIQAHSCMWGGYVAAVLRDRYGIPYVITEHRGRFNERSYFKQREILRWQHPLLQKALTGADAIIPVSERLIRVMENIACRPLPCKPIPNPVDEEFFNGGTPQQRSDQFTEFLTITNFQPYKAINILLEAFHQAIQQKAEIRLRIAGEGNERPEYEARAKTLGLNDRIIFMGHQTPQEIRNLLHASDFLVLSSHNEGQPVSVGEAELCGKPVICTDVVSKQDVPDFAGLLVETGNPKALSEAMLFAHNHKNSFDNRTIRIFALGRFSRKAVIAEIIQVMQSIVHTGTSQ